MLKSYVVCDCCGKTLEEPGIKFVQPVSFNALPPNGQSTKRIDVKGTEFCSEKCIAYAFEQALSNFYHHAT